MIIHLAHKVELKPNKAQVLYFKKACGTARFAYNWALAEWKKQYEEGKKPNGYELRKQLTASIDTEFPWMREVSKTASQYGIYNLNSAFHGFFKKISSYPKFKKKGIHDSYQLSDGNSIKLKGNRLHVPRLGLVKMQERLRFPNEKYKSCRVIKCTVSRKADKWFASFDCELDYDPPPRENQAEIGVDLGISHLAILSTGEKYENPKALTTRLRQLKTLNKSLHRKQKGSKNREKARNRIARLYYKISNIRKNALHQLSYDLTTRFTNIGIEDLNVSGMAKNRKLSRAIHDVGFFELRRQLSYKAAINGANIHLAPRFYPSSKLCSCCGVKNENLTLSDRVWRCGACGMVHDRDINAANNLKPTALKSRVEACGVDVRHEVALAASAATVKQESSKE